MGFHTEILFTQLGDNNSYVFKNLYYKFSRGARVAAITKLEYKS